MNDGARLRAVVLEDEWPTRNHLVRLIEGTGMAHVAGAVSTLDEAQEVLSAVPVDVVFVDVHLSADGEARSGLDLVRSLADVAGGPIFVLATAYSQHALEGFDLGVVDYLLKPFGEERVARCLKRLVERRAPALTGVPRVVARRRKSLVFRDRHEIWAFEASERLTFVHSPQGRFDVDLSLSAIEASFGRALVRVHRNWLVNLAHVRELERDGGATSVFVGSGVGPESCGVRAPVSRDHAQELREMLLACSTGLKRSVT